MIGWADSAPEYYVPVLTTSAVRRHHRPNNGRNALRHRVDVVEKKLSSVNVGDVPKLVTKPLEAKTVCFFRREWSRSNAKTPLTRNLG